MQLEGLRRVSNRYESGKGYTYWYDGSEDVSVNIIAADSIHNSDPGKTPLQTVAPVVKAKDERLIAAPGDEPITIGKVPPLRDFVNEHRDEDIA